MKKTRKIHRVIKSKPTLEGAGVHLNRAFGFSEPRSFDPFLLLDDFRSEILDDYIKGFPWHPHRGIETITYMLTGKVEHGDSMGNSGVIEPGDVQWMTAGSGIIHQEMPKGDLYGRMGGFQLWANLPAKQKMMEPRYREVKSSQIPLVTATGGVSIRIISGEVDGTRGPVQDIITDPEYLDISLPAGAEFYHPTQAGHTVLAYVIEGQAYFDQEKKTRVENRYLVQFEAGEQVVASAPDVPARFLLISGKPIGEPVAWFGPIVMNTEEELQTAFDEYRDGTFIKHKKVDYRRSGA
jgi:redox-sensitive bicupin YhaK (pirin superfamily)